MKPRNEAAARAPGSDAPAPGARFELRVESVGAGGDGVGHAPDGRVVFVPWTAPGDRVRVRVTDAGRRFLRAQVEELLEPGPDRVPPPCPVFGVCGGCRWQHLRYEAQVAAKRRILEDALSRIGGLRLDAPVELVPSPRAYGYRQRARVVAEGGRVGFRRARSHELCPTERCAVLVPPLEAALAGLARSRPADGEWELLAQDDGHVRVTPLTTPGRASRAPVRHGDEQLEVSGGVFVQANAALLDALVEAVARAAGSGDAALDLFAGAGAFTLPLARSFRRVIAVEADARAARDLRHNLSAAGLEHASVTRSRVDRALRTPAVLASRWDVVVLDPPRTGLDRASFDALTALDAVRLVYVSCDPATLARDLGRLAARGFRLEGVRGFDGFPQTPHVEAVARLVRSSDADGAAPHAP